MQHYYPKKSNFFKYFVVAGLFFVLGWQMTVSGIWGLNSSLNVEDSGASDRLQQNVDLSLFWTVYEEILDRYYKEDKVDEETMVYGAVKGLVNSLDDPYTVFMDPDETEEFNASLEGTLEGIGAELSVEDQVLVIVSPLKDSPAEKAGLLPRDVIYKINDEYANDMTLFDAIMSIRGKKGTTVTLTIIRDGVDEPFEVSIVRDQINLESVTMEELDDDIVYISINQFSDRTIEEFNAAISGLILNEPKGLIIDLRYNGGGYLDIAIDILSFLLPSHTEAVKIDSRVDEEIMYTNGNEKLLNVPIVVLVNEGSASASEIVAGAIQDLKRGVVMGTQTFGKGTVQEVNFFNDGSSIRLTIAQWLTPDGRSIQEVGLTPDIIEELSDEDIENEFDSQKDAAIEYLKGL